jgi:hypothetical protein
MPQAMDIDRNKSQHPFHHPVSALFGIPAGLQIDMVQHLFKPGQTQEVDQPEKLCNPAKPLRNGFLFCIHPFNAKSR